MTFTITILPDDVKVDVDFVPVIEFTHPKWPAKPVRPLSDQLIKAKVIVLRTLAEVAFRLSLHQRYTICNTASVHVK
jgi:hypothetical protein